MSEKNNNLEKILKDLELDEVLTSVKSDDEISTESFYKKPLEPPKKSISQASTDNAEKEAPADEGKEKKKKSHRKKSDKTKDKKNGEKLKASLSLAANKLKSLPKKVKTGVLITLCVLLAIIIAVSAVSYSKTAYLKPYEAKYNVSFPKGIAEDLCDAYGKDRSTVGAIAFGDDGENVYLTDKINLLSSYTEYGTELDSQQQFKAVSVADDAADIEEQYSQAASFVDASQKITVEDFYGDKTVYQVVAAFYTNISSLDDNGYVFPYYFYGDLTEDSFDGYEDKINSRSLYYTGYNLSYNDSFMTVSTNSKVYDYCKFVILCKEVDGDFEKITETTPNERIRYPQKWYDDNDEHNLYWLASKWQPTIYTDKKHTQTKQLIL